MTFGASKAELLEDIQEINRKEELGRLSSKDMSRRYILKDVLYRKLKQEETKWKYRSNAGDSRKVIKTLNFSMAWLRQDSKEQNL